MCFSKQSAHELTRGGGAKRALHWLDILATTLQRDMTNRLGQQRREAGLQALVGPFGASGFQIT